jgi:hypothetical protein
MRRVLVTLIVGAICSFPIAAWAGPITILGSTVQSCAAPNNGSASCSPDTSTTYGARMVSAANEGASSTTWVNWIDAGPGGALFDFDFAHTRLGQLYSYAQSYGSITFMALEDTTYAISGSYTVTDVGDPGLVYSYASLHRPNGVPVFRDVSHSSFTANEILTVGSNTDGEINTFVGSATGTLLAGQTYEFLLIHYLSTVPEADRGASATGCVTLTIGVANGAGSCGSPATVPDNGISTASLLALALGVLACSSQRRCLHKSDRSVDRVIAAG